MRRALWLAIVLAACSGVRSESALGEPLRVRSASFKEGALPGTPGARPEVTSIETASNVVRPGQTDKSISGRTSTDAVAVAVAFADIGTGYWVFPVGGPDPANGGEFEWSAPVEFGTEIPPGPHELRVVAIDGAGHAGTQRTLSLCVASSTPDNLAACDKAAKLPTAAVSLTWDAPADLDLVVAAPDGTIIDSKRPRNGDADAGTGLIDRDSSANCAIDSIRREDLVFQNPPPAGSYLIYANLFSACGHPPVHFRVTVTEGRTVTVTRAGTLLAADANGGARLGTFVTELAFQ